MGANLIGIAQERQSSFPARRIRLAPCLLVVWAVVTSHQTMMLEPIEGQLPDLDVAGSNRTAKPILPNYSFKGDSEF